MIKIKSLISISLIIMTTLFLLCSCGGNASNNNSAVEITEDPIPELIQLAGLITDQNDVIISGWKDDCNGPSLKSEEKEFDTKLIAANSLWDENQVKSYLESNYSTIQLYINSYYFKISNKLTELNIMDMLTGKTNKKKYYECTIKNLKVYSDIYGETNNFSVIEEKLISVATRLDKLNLAGKIDNNLYNEASSLVSKIRKLNTFNKNTISFIMNYDNYESVADIATHLNYYDEVIGDLINIRSSIEAVSSLMN